MSGCPAADEAACLLSWLLSDVCISPFVVHKCLWSETEYLVPQELQWFPELIIALVTIFTSYCPPPFIPHIASSLLCVPSDFILNT